MTILDRLNIAPPFLCRMLARKARGRLPMSHSEIAKAANLPRSTVVDLSFKRSWETVPVGAACRFAMACGVNHLSLKQQLHHLRLDRQRYQEKANGNQRRLYSRLWKIFDEHFRSARNGTPSSSLSPAA